MENSEATAAAAAAAAATAAAAANLGGESRLSPTLCFRDCSTL